MLARMSSYELTMWAALFTVHEEEDEDARDEARHGEVRDRRRERDDDEEELEDLTPEQLELERLAAEDAALLFKRPEGYHDGPTE